MVLVRSNRLHGKFTTPNTLFKAVNLIDTLALCVLSDSGILCRLVSAATRGHRVHHPGCGCPPGSDDYARVAAVQAKRAKVARLQRARVIREKARQEGEERLS